MKRPRNTCEDDEDAESVSSPKRPTKAAKDFSGDQSIEIEGDTAESQLEAMLAAEGRPLEQSAPDIDSPPRGFSAMAPSCYVPGIDLAGGVAAAVAQAVALAPPPVTDFSRPVQNLPTREVPVPKNLLEYLMTPEHRCLLLEESGAEVEWDREESQVKLRGSPESLRRATRLLQRVYMHCHWGRSESKVTRLLRPQMLASAICRLSPMNTLRPFEKILNAASPVMTIGKERGNDIMISDQIISRQHCALELDPDRGAVYIIDCSTNGTFLNGVRLPSKTVGKVLISHGDELLFKDPKTGDAEFGYIVNLNELGVRSQLKLSGPRRLLSAEEMSTTSRDLN